MNSDYSENDQSNPPRLDSRAGTRKRFLDVKALVVECPFNLLDSRPGDVVAGCPGVLGGGGGGGEAGGLQPGGGQQGDLHTAGGQHHTHPPHPR